MLSGLEVHTGCFRTDCVCLQAEMEQALLQAEKQAEQEQAEAESDTISQLQLKLSQLDTSTQKEKQKVGAGPETGLLRASACLCLTLFPDRSLQTQRQVLILLVICWSSWDTSTNQLACPVFFFQNFPTLNFPANLTFTFSPLTILPPLPNSFKALLHEPN